MTNTDLRIAEQLDAVVFARRLGLHLDPWQTEVVRPRRRQMVILATRQAGKSSATAVRALHKTEFLPGATVLVAAPGERQAMLMLQAIKTLYKRYPSRRRVAKWNTMSVEFWNGATIEALPGTPDTLRGYSAIDLLILDEASRVVDALYHALRPMLAVSGGDLVILSTPNGKRGFFYNIWSTTEGDPTWHRVGPIMATEIPRITAAFLAEERANLPRAIYEQEYQCRFTDQVGAVFLQDQIAATLSSGQVAPLFPQSSPEPLFDPAVIPLLSG